MPAPDRSEFGVNSETQKLEDAADQAITARGGDAREAVKALIVANRFLETDMEKLRAAMSRGYARPAAGGGQDASA
jgi:hypothetical protein